MAVLEVGCGDSPLITGIHSHFTDSFDLSCYAIDYSERIIHFLQSKEEIHDKIEYSVQDARKLSFKESMFDLIVEKGTVDAMLCTSNKSTGLENVLNIIKESCRVLTVSGCIMLVSHIQTESEEFELLLQECILPALSNYSDGVVWSIEAHTIGEDITTTTNAKRMRKSCEGGNNATVYLIKSRARKITRSITKPIPVDFQVFTH